MVKSPDLSVYLGIKSNFYNTVLQLDEGNINLSLK